MVIMRWGLIRTTQRCCSESPKVFGFVLCDVRLMILSNSGVVVVVYSGFTRALSSMVYR